MSAEPMSTQRQAFNLLGAAIPLTVKWPEHHPANLAKYQVNPPKSPPKTSRNSGLAVV
jgi:hypothetical protein